MNRHQKRKQQALIKKAPQAAVLDTMGAIQDFAETVDKLKPYLAVIRQMAEKIDDCISVIRDVELRNDSLKAELALQREVTLRMFFSSTECGRSLEEFRLLERQIQDEILKESTPDGTPTEPTESSSEQEDPGPGAEVGLADPPQEGNSAG